MSFIIPIPKKGSTKDMNNFRPVALASNLGKLVEGAVRRQMSCHLEEILPTTMYGFRKNKGTVDALINVLDNVKNALNSGKKVAIVALDASAAFDVLDHDLVLESLAIMGAGETMLGWLRSYFSDRYSFVDIDLLCLH